MDARGRPDKKLEDFALTRTLLAEGILQQLILLLRSFADPDRLHKRFGLGVQYSSLASITRHPDPDLAADLRYAASYLYDYDGRRFSRTDLAVLTEHRLTHTALLEKIRFVSVASTVQLDELVARLDEFNRNVQLFTANDTRNRRVFELMVKDAGADPDRTRRLAEAAAYEAKQSVDPGAKSEYDEWSKFANFSLALQSATPDAMSRKKVLSRREFSFDGPYVLGPHSTLARLLDYPVKHQSRLVLVEWVTVGKSTPIVTKFDEMKEAWYVFHAEKPDKILLPGSIGLIYDETDVNTIGYVFQLPAHIRSNLPTRLAGGRGADFVPKLVRSPSTLAAERKPTSLRQLIKKENRGIDLGIRFNIAKQVLDALHLMHTAGFIHRLSHPSAHWHSLRFSNTQQKHPPR